MKTTLVLSISFILMSTSILSQTLPAQAVAKYNDNNTPYPLYGGSFGIDLKLNQSDLEILANNFDAFYGAYDISKEQAEVVYSINPDFEFLKYNGNWRVYREDMQWVERGNRNEILYYKAGTLESNISESDTILRINDIFGKLYASNTPRDSMHTYRDGNKSFHTAFLKIGSEFLKIIAVDQNTITVMRGIDGSQVQAHKSGSNVLCPVYGRPYDPESYRSPDYRHDSKSLLRWKRFLKTLVQQKEEINGGIWIDILIGNLSHFAMSGETLPDERIWDTERDMVYDKMLRANYAEEGIQFMQEAYHAIYNEYPVIWGNNMMFPLEKSNDRLQMLLSTPHKPRPIDGFAMENCFAQYGYGGNSGKEFFYTSYNDWKQVIQSIMYMGELKVSARPLMMDGGIDNKKYAALPKERRHELYLYSYASYLLAVKVEPDDKIYSKLGLCPVILEESGHNYFEIAPCFTWKIGRPAETFAPEDFMKYNIEGTDIYARKFENGIVLVNPSEKISSKLRLKTISAQTMYNPESGQTVKSVQLKPRTGLMLLYKK